MSDHKTLIAVPALDLCATSFAHSLATLRRSGPSKVTFMCGKPVCEAREDLAWEAIDDDCDRILWIDSDMVFSHDAMIELDRDIDDGWDLVCGIFFKRRLPVTPVIYSELDVNASKSKAIYNYPQNELFKIAGCGFGMVMTTVDLCKRVQAQFGEMFTPINRMGEDLSFCWRAGQVGGVMACDSRIKVGHAGQVVYCEEMYQRPKEGEKRA